MGLFEVGVFVYGYIEKFGFIFEVDVFIGIGFVDMYLKCGCLISVIFVFELMRVKNVLIWILMVMGLVFNGRGNEILSFLNRMAEFGIKLNVVIFISLFLVYCYNGFV